jgi:hypothetical protein
MGSKKVMKNNVEGGTPPTLLEYTAGQFDLNSQFPSRISLIKNLNLRTFHHPLSIIQLKLK